MIMVALLLSLGAPALAGAAAASGPPKPEPQKAPAATSPAAPVPDPAPQPQTPTASPDTPVSPSQPVGSGVGVAPVSTGRPVGGGGGVTPRSTPSTPVTRPSPSSGSAVRVPQSPAAHPSTHSVARSTQATTPATHRRAAPRRKDSRRPAATDKPPPSHAPLALTLLTHQDLPRLPSNNPFAIGPVGSSGGISAIDAATLVLAGIVLLSPLVPPFRRALVKAAGLRSSRHN
jgi:hypothetical protein